MRRAALIAGLLALACAPFFTGQRCDSITVTAIADAPLNPVNIYLLSDRSRLGDYRKGRKVFSTLTDSATTTVCRSRLESRPLWVVLDPVGIDRYYLPYDDQVYPWSTRVEIHATWPINYSHFEVY